MRSWRVITVLLLCLGLVGSTACIGGGEEEEAKQQEVEVVRGDLTVSVSGSGDIVVSDEVRLAFGTSGKVDKIYVEEGDEVSKGEVLAKLDTSALELALTQAQATLAQAQVSRAQAQVALDEAEYNLEQLEKRLSSTHDRVKIAKSQLEAAESQLEATEQQIEAAEQSMAQAQKQLDEAAITASLNGIIAGVGVDEGDTVSATTIIVHLIDLSSMELNVNVDEIDIPLIKLNQRAIIEVDALPALQLEGKVTFLSSLPTVEAGIVSYEVTIGLNVSEDSELKVGMSATADIIIDERSDVLLVPSGAISPDSSGNPMVKVMVNEQIQERAVTLGISDGYQTEIVSGLNEGETVVIESRAKTEPSRQGGFLFGG